MSPEEEALRIPSILRWPGPRPGPATDPIWMDFFLLDRELDRKILDQAHAIRLRTVAQVYRAIAEGAEEASQLFRQG